MLLLTKAIFAIMIGFLSSSVLGLILVPLLKKLRVGQKEIPYTSYPLHLCGRVWRTRGTGSGISSGDQCRLRPHGRQLRGNAAGQVWGPCEGVRPPREPDPRPGGRLDRLRWGEGTGC